MDIQVKEGEKKGSFLLREFFEQKQEDALPEEQPPIIIEKGKTNKGIGIDTLFRKFFEHNNEIFLLGGELDPDFYGNIINNYGSLLAKTAVKSIGGPYIAIKDEMFLKYHKVHKNRLENWWYAEKKNNWWEAHPFFQKAYEKDNIKINITKQRIERHFCIGINTKTIYVEDPHEELEKANGKLFLNNARLTNKYLTIWNDINNCYCYEWNKEEPKSILLFKPCSIFGEEKKLKEIIKEEFSELLIKIRKNKLSTITPV